MEFSTIIFWVVLLGLVFYVVNIYNSLVTFKNRYLNAFSQIEVQLKRRYDLIPNLVETAKGYMQHERETLDAVISARNDAAAILKAMGDSGADRKRGRDQHGSQHHQAVRARDRTFPPGYLHWQPILTYTSVYIYIFRTQRD
jgi:hypothetical protein